MEGAVDIAAKLSEDIRQFRIWQNYIRSLLQMMQKRERKKAFWLWLGSETLAK